MNTHPNVTALKLKKKSRLLEISFSDGSQHSLSCEFLRVHSPSAEVHGHGKPVLVTHKKEVNIKAIEPVGNYAVKLIFDDGHDTGLYSWKVLWDLANNQTQLWEQYLARLRAEKGSREPLIAMNIKYN
ncbi:MAG: gamma-butyrobetaine hydroxylase-like domain-containing protein [Shewanella sp.]|nr:gamma-butyrobetaine hydroxylase-like domain-containing protein [Shewanella sp.]MCF1430135.1 gamma-butyrobetaine hydroxylase-like domain-containing protein [Shewanella sp.]MCF1438539.1 gamma-butyrobetaine hydroxylase-like domain-containing protein [Shewanella sp.]MCF1458819.1 gamma-butyrobetaine hydroxylase-like domain-containing protein [Shewanella sp.]